MNERGWGWTASEIRQIQLIEWIVPQPTEHFVPVKPFYDDLPDQAANTFQVAHADLKLLEERSLIDQASGLGGMDGLDVMATPQARALAEQLEATRANKRLRRSACRDAMIAWLYSADATSPRNQPARDAMLDESQYCVWFAETFSPSDLDTAAAWLRRQGLVEGIVVAGEEGPVRLYLTDAGVRCAEEFDSDTDRYVDKQRIPGSGPIVNIGTNSGPFQVAGDHAHQVQNIGASAEHLRELIVGLGELVRSLVPSASGIDGELEQALAAAADGAVNNSVLKRFADWVMSTVKTGATAAVVPAVSSATTAMLLEASRLATGHL